jgi:hypothetical protein
MENKSKNAPFKGIPSRAAGAVIPPPPPCTQRLSIRYC